MLIEIIVEPKKSVRWPKMKLAINDTVVHNGFCTPNNKSYLIIKHELKDPKENNVISLTHFDKSGNETITDKESEIVSDRAIILRSIKIGEHIVPEVVLYDKTFYAKFTREQTKEDPTRSSAIKNNLYFGFNGTYEYEFSDDANKHYFENLIEKERLANISNKKTITRPDGKVVEAFEFTGKLVDSEVEESITIEELHKIVNNVN